MTPCAADLYLLIGAAMSGAQHDMTVISKLNNGYLSYQRKAHTPLQPQQKLSAASGCWQ